MRALAHIGARRGGLGRALPLFGGLLCAAHHIISELRDRDGVAVPQPFLGVSSLDFGPLLREWPFFVPDRSSSRAGYSAAIRRGVRLPTSDAAAATTARRASVRPANPVVSARLASFM